MIAVVAIGRRPPAALLAAGLLAVAGGGPVGAARDVVRVVPEIILPDEGAIQNAGAGTEIWNGGPGNGVTNLVRYAVRVSDHAVNSMIRVSWADYEKGEGDYCFHEMDRHFEHCIRYGQKLDIGCFVTSNGGTKQTIDGAFCCYPAYVHEAMQRSDHKDVVNTLWLNKQNHWEPNFENRFFFERYDALLRAFADYLRRPISVDGRSVVRSKLVRCIELRHFGFWGEGAYPKNLMPSTSAPLIRFADAFVRHFPGIRLVMPTNGMRFSPAYDALRDYHFHLLTLRNHAGLLGTFRDNWGDNEERYRTLYYASNRYERAGVRMFELIRDRWKTAPLVGEPGRWGPTPDGFHPYWNLHEQVAYLHPAVIRNCNVSTGRSVTNPTDYSILDDPKALDAFQRMYAIIGFRYLFTSARASRDGDGLAIAVDWLNIGLTPTYDAWKVRFLVEDAEGRETWSGVSALDLRSLLPADGIPAGVVDAGRARTVTDRFPDVPPSGRLHLQILDPDGLSPPMALSIRGRTETGAYPLGDL